MSDTGAPGGLPDEPADAPAGPHRVIGTPPPAQARTLLGERAGDGRLAAGTAGAARRSGRIRARPSRQNASSRRCFILSMLASIGFIAAYIGLEVRLGRCGAALQPGPRPRPCRVAFLALAVGATIWVRHLMPNVEITEQRHPLASDPEDRQAFEETFAEGAEASQFVKRPLLRRTLIAATLPLAAAPVVLLRDMGPLPGTTLRHTVWRKGMRLLTYGANTPITAG